MSKQTLYNRFPSKLDIGRAIAERQSELITAPLRDGGDALSVLTALATSLLERVRTGRKAHSLRGVVLMSGEVPELAQTIYEAGPGESLRRLAAWIADQQKAGVIGPADPLEAAEAFTGLVLGHAHLRAMMATPHPEIDTPRRAADAARRFLRAYGP